MEVVAVTPSDEGPEPAASSVRCAPASGSGSGPAFAHREVEKACLENGKPMRSSGYL
jgi:hypothetical protein